MINSVGGVHIQVLVPHSQVIVVNVLRVFCVQLTADLLGPSRQQGPGLWAAKPPGPSLTGEWVRRAVNSKPFKKIINTYYHHYGWQTSCH